MGDELCSSVAGDNNLRMYCIRVDCALAGSFEKLQLDNVIIGSVLVYRDVV